MTVLWTEIYFLAKILLLAKSLLGTYGVKKFISSSNNQGGYNNVYGQDYGYGNIQDVIVPRQQCYSGEQREFGGVLLVCVNGQYEQQACLTPSGRQIWINDQLRSETGVYTCIKNYDGSLLLKPVACMTNTGIAVYQGQQQQIGQIFYECRQLPGDQLVLAPVACTNSDGQMVQNGGLIELERKYADVSFFYRCVINGDEIRLQQDSCRVDGQTIQINQQDTPSRRMQAYVRCVANGDSGIKLAAVACIHSTTGQRVEVGQSVTERSFSITCVQRGDVVSFEPTGCLDQNGRTVPIGQTLEIRSEQSSLQSSGLGYIAECVRDYQLNAITLRYVKCVYQGVPIEPGCAKRFQNTLVLGCNRGFSYQQPVRGYFRMTLSDQQDVQYQEQYIRNTLSQRNLQLC